jgi:hypothetical protein
LSLKDCLKRGSLVAAANWQVVIVQFVADALFKTLLAVPIVGGVFLAVLLIGGDPSEILSLPLTDVLPTMASALLAQPLALAAFLVAMALVVGGGSLLMFLVKGGTVTVLVEAERGAGAIEHPPLRLPAFRRAMSFSLERFTSGAISLFGRYARLGLLLTAVYAVSSTAFLAVVFREPDPSADWQLLAVAASLALVGWISVVNALYLLCQMAIAADDCTTAQAIRRIAALLRRDGRTIALVFAAILALVALTTAASILATAALGLIAFVPLVGLAALPLQLMAWLVRGLVFQYLALTALAAYTRVYRGEAAAGPIELRRIG